MSYSEYEYSIVNQKLENSLEKLLNQRHEMDDMKNKFEELLDQLEIQASESIELIKKFRVKI